MAGKTGGAGGRWLSGIVVGPVLLVLYATWVGRAFLLSALLLAAAGLRSQSNAIILVACVLGGALLAGGLAAHLFLLGLHVGGGFAEDEVFVGDPVHLRVAVRNKCILPAGMLSLSARPGAGLSPTAASSEIPRLSARAVETAELRFGAAARGRRPAPDLRVRSIYPTGLFRTGRLWKLDGEVLVLPRIGRFGGRFRALLAGSEQSRVYSPAFLAGETRGLREYRPGDSLRRVHWRMTAHRGGLVVREFEEPAGREVVLLLDACRPPGRRDDFEWTVSLAATLAARAAEENLRASIVLGGRHPEVLYCDRGRGMREALRRLALFRGVRRSFRRELLETVPPQRTGGVVLLAGLAAGPAPDVVTVSPEKDRDLLVFEEVRDA